jgi:hypothetical protein
LNKKALVITNNPEVYKRYESNHQMVFVQGGYYDVLVEVRNLVHKGYELITHPLAGSIKPNETPYRSIVVKQGTNTNLQSVEIIEASIQAYEKFERMTTKWNQSTLEDFQFVDLKLFESALEDSSFYI